MRLRFQASQFPWLFSSVEPVVIRVGDESLEDVICKGQWDTDACREEVDDLPKRTESEEPRGQESSVVTQAGDGNPCIIVGQLCPSAAFTVGLEVQGPLSKAVVDTGAGVSLLCTQVYDQLKVKPPIKRHVKMMQVGDNLHMIIARVARCIHKINLYVTPSRTPC